MKITNFSDLPLQAQMRDKVEAAFDNTIVTGPYTNLEKAILSIIEGDRDETTK